MRTVGSTHIEQKMANTFTDGSLDPNNKTSAMRNGSLDVSLINFFRK